jgi:CubicO group peptidase (beta-lactamase class C family)
MQTRNDMRIASVEKARSTCVWAVAWFLVVCTTPLTAQGSDFPDDAAMEQELRAFVEIHRGAPGVVVGLLDAKGRRVYAFGESGRAEHPKLDGATRFEIGSITKTFTGILLADMLLAGEVSAEQRVSTLFPRGIALDNGIEDATLEQLATHTAGLPRIAVDLAALSRTLSVDPYAGTTADDVYRSVAAVPRWLVSRTQISAYSNLGYALLGRLLELRAGQGYEELVRGRVLEPLGIGSIATAHAEPPPLEMARGHGSGGRPTSDWHVDGYAPAGCVIASANELLEYLAINLAASNPAVREAQRQRKTLPDGRGIGLGWMHSKVGGHSLIWHDGITGGFRSIIVFLPDEGRGLVVLANGQGDVNALARRLLDPAEPPLPEHGTNAAVGFALTAILLAWGPLTLLGSIRREGQALRHASEAASPSNLASGTPASAPPPQSSRVRMDRFDVLRSPLTPAIALVLAERLGAWQEVPFVAWWGALTISALAFAILVHRARVLPWFQGGVWRAIGRGSMVALEVTVLAFLFS